LAIHVLDRNLAGEHTDVDPAASGRLLVQSEVAPRNVIDSLQVACAIENIAPGSIDGRTLSVMPAIRST
jgi:hypothetical protein